MLNSLSITRWRQFDRLSIELHPRLTVIVGANGTGKSSILHILASFNRSTAPTLTSFPATPSACISGKVEWSTNYYGDTKRYEKDTIRVGSIEFATGKRSAIITKRNSGKESSLYLAKSTKISGTHIASARMPSPRVPIANPNQIPDSIRDLLTAYLTNYRRLIQDDRKKEDYVHPWSILKGWLFRLCSTSSSNKYNRGDLGNENHLRNFCNLLKQIFPEQLKFLHFEVCGKNLICKTELNEFSFDSLSGGLASLLEITFQLYLCSLQHDEFIVTFDEPENHLHASMQMRLLGTLCAAFPKAQFIVATHSPVMVNSLETSKIYILRWTSDSHVSAESLSGFRMSSSADEVLRDVIGTTSSIPLWASNKLQVILEKYRSTDFDRQVIENFYSDLRTAGLEQFSLSSLTELTRTHDQNR